MHISIPSFRPQRSGEREPPRPPAGFPSGQGRRPNEPAARARTHERACWLTHETACCARSPPAAAARLRRLLHLPARLSLPCQPARGVAERALRGDDQPRHLSGDLRRSLLCDDHPPDAEDGGDHSRLRPLHRLRPPRPHPPPGAPLPHHLSPPPPFPPAPN